MKTVKKYEIPGEPVAWSSHRGFGRKSFSPHYVEKEAARFYLKKQHGDSPLYTKGIRVHFEFLMPVPSSMPKKVLKRILAGEKVFHVKRKDRSNCIKFAEDCLTGVVIADDNIICDGSAQKYYSDNPRTIITIEEIDGA